MTESERLGAIEDIRQLRAKYWRGVDSHDGILVRSILAEDCVLDYNGCMTDPTSGVDHMPVMNLVLTGRDSWQTDNLEGPKIVTVHQGHQHEIDVTGAATAEGIWYFTDRFFMPVGGPFSLFAETTQADLLVSRRRRSRESEFFSRTALPMTEMSLHAIAPAAINGPEVPRRPKAAAGIAMLL